MLSIHLRSEGSEGLDNVLYDLVEGSESLAEDHTHVDVLEVQHSNGHVGTQDQYQQDQVPKYS